MRGLMVRTAWMIAGCLTLILPVLPQTSQVNPEATAGSQSPISRRAAFVGTWRLDLSKSYMGSDHPEANYGFTKTFVLNGSTLVQKDHEVNVEIIGFAMPERNSTADFVPDRQEHTIEQPGFFPGMPPVHAQVVVEWQGDNLLVTESSQSFIGPANTSRRYYLSEDGGELIELVVGRTTFGDSKAGFARLSSLRERHATVTIGRFSSGGRRGHRIVWMSIPVMT